MKVKAKSAPKTEKIKSAIHIAGFTGTFFIANYLDDLSIIRNLIFETTSKWVGFLMKLRNKVVKLFGLKTEKPEDFYTGFQVGGYIGFFKIFNINEIMLEANNKRLNFRESIYNSYETLFNIKVSTLVKYNNRFGEIFMTIVKPFHHIFVKAMVNQAYKLTARS